MEIEGYFGGGGGNTHRHNKHKTKQKKKKKKKKQQQDQGKEGGKNEIMAAASCRVVSGCSFTFHYEKVEKEMRQKKKENKIKNGWRLVVLSKYSAPSLCVCVLCV